ncbi:MAG: DUF2155 domain-containing protein [Alphaproteobacteria bacterium]|nr:DUF2155 domain-containing protein [Alphaproteobacteria bacterium]
MKWLNCASLIFFIVSIFYAGHAPPAFAFTYEEYPSIKLRSLDKITARTLTFDAQVGSTIKFGDIFIKIQSCRKPPAIEKNESSAFLQIWQVDRISKESRWVFSGWMFSSSPALSSMDHPVYDVWVIDCFGKDPDAIPVQNEKPPEALPDEGTVPENAVIEPDVSPEKQQDTLEDIRPEQKKNLPPSRTYDAPPKNTDPSQDEIEGIY